MASKKRKTITKTELTKRFPYLTDKLIKAYLPEPVSLVRQNNSLIPVWEINEVMEICSGNRELKDRMEKNRHSVQTNRDLHLAYQAFVSRFTPFDKFHYAEKLDRKFILHIGPTNSGKTYTALEALKNAGSGVYLGPLRLMALEVFDKLNCSGKPCSLLTGEESIPVPCSDFMASTVEMADFQKQYDIAVIDEAQMISDPHRGARWFDAICQINAKTVHICLAPEGEQIITDILRYINAPYEISYHKRLAPLEVRKQLSGLKDILPGDAIIAFSREKVLGIAAAIKYMGYEPAIIYGGLPPKSRRLEVADYISGKKNIIVATDAIGMGLSLPIRRIVFADIKKFDGQRRRTLTNSEVKQIAGRAGRFGIFDKGEVTSFKNIRYISEALQNGYIPPKKIRISFPGEEAVASDYPLKELLLEWQRLPRENWFERENMENAMKLLSIFPGKIRKTDKETLYKLITVPVDPDKTYIAGYWKQCAEAVLADRDIPVPNFGMNSLQRCEMQYKALDLYKIMCSRFDRKNFCESFQEEVIQRISILLQEPDSRFRLEKSLTENYPETAETVIPDSAA